MKNRRNGGGGQEGGAKRDVLLSMMFAPLNCGSHITTTISPTPTGEKVHIVAALRFVSSEAIVMMVNRRGWAVVLPSDGNLRICDDHRGVRRQHRHLQHGN